jgi:hypothetical protein
MRIPKVVEHVALIVHRGARLSSISGMSPSGRGQWERVHRGESGDTRRPAAHELERVSTTYRSECSCLSANRLELACGHKVEVTFGLCLIRTFSGQECKRALVLGTTPAHLTTNQNVAMLNRAARNPPTVTHRHQGRRK